MNGHDKIFETKAEMLLARQVRESRIKERYENRLEVEKCGAETMQGLTEVDDLSDDDDDCMVHGAGPGFCCTTSSSASR